MNNNQLYIKPIEFEKVSYRRVSENPAEWTGNIMEAFYSQFPFFANSPVSVSLTQKDEQKGYALGSIEIKEGNMGIHVPVIIQNRELYPFDVAIMNNKIVPLTNTTLNLYVQGRGAFLRVVKPDAGDPTTALFNSSFSQVITPTFITDQFKTAEVECKIEGCTDPTHKHSKREMKPSATADVQVPVTDAMGKRAGFKDEMAINSLKLELLTEQVNKETTKARHLGATMGMALHPVSMTAGATIGKGVGHILANALKSQLLEDRVLDHMQKEALLGGQIKADQLFNEALEKVKQGSKAGQYLALCFRKWAVEQGFNVMHWDIPGFEKIGESIEKKEERLGKDLDHDKEKGENPKHKKKIEEAKYKKTASVLDSVASTITAEMKNKFFQTLQKNASIVEGFKQNGTEDIIIKLAALTPGTVNFKERVRKELDRDIHYIYKSASEYKMILGNSKVNDPIEITVPADVVENMGMVKTSASYMIKEASFDHTLACVQTPNGPIAILSNNDYTYIPLQYRDKVSFVKSAQVQGQLKIAEPVVGLHGLWADFNYSHNPFEVTKMWTENGKDRIETWDGMNKISYCRMRGIEAPYSENSITYLPQDMKIVKLGSLINPNERLVGDPTHTNEVLCLDSNAFLLRGNELNEHLKTASKECDYNKTAWHLLQCGGTSEDLKKISKLQNGELYRIPHDLTLPIPFEKVAEKLQLEYDKQVRSIRNIAKDFIKEASALTDPQTVDAALSLNFVNRDNIVEFAKALPEFEEVVNTLADMLLKTRLGVRVVEESILRRVMLGIVDIIEVLAGISNLAGGK